MCYYLTPVVHFLTLVMLWFLSGSQLIADQINAPNTSSPIYGGGDGLSLPYDTPIYRVQPPDLSLIPHQSPYFSSDRYCLPSSCNRNNSIYFALDRDGLNGLRTGQGYFDSGNTMHQTTLGSYIDDLRTKGWDVDVIYDGPLKATTGLDGVIIHGKIPEEFNPVIEKGPPGSKNSGQGIDGPGVKPDLTPPGAPSKPSKCKKVFQQLARSPVTKAAARIAGPLAAAVDGVFRGKPVYDAYYEDEEDWMRLLYGAAGGMVGAGIGGTIGAAGGAIGGGAVGNVPGGVVGGIAGGAAGGYAGDLAGSGIGTGIYDTSSSVGNWLGSTFPSLFLW
jgi:hypothetical protein